jgi:hypothetical protein
MRSLFLLLSLAVMTLSCNDGDIITIDLDFDQNLELCDSYTSSYLLFDQRDDPYESLSLIFPKTSQFQSILNPVEPLESGTFNINGSNVRFNYRTYSSDPSSYLCQEIPDASVVVTNDIEAPTGIVNYTSTYVDDDDDGVPNALEFDGDTDGDGIMNFMDSDDDGDNVPTANEKPDPDNNGDISDAQDTDGDNLPDYLDNDDDGDGTLTQHEDENNDGNLFNDFGPGAIVSRFLDDSVNQFFETTFSYTNSFKRTYSITFEIQDIDLEFIATDGLLFGTYENTVTF